MTTNYMKIKRMKKSQFINLAYNTYGNCIISLFGAKNVENMCKKYGSCGRCFKVGLIRRWKMTTNYELLKEEFNEDIDSAVNVLYSFFYCTNCPAQNKTSKFDCGDDCHATIKLWLNQEIEECTKMN